MSSTILDPAFVPDATVVVDDVSVWFGQKVALSELSCSFGPGVTGLLGPNGAGKTTLMRAMCGLIPTRRGEVTVLGHDPRGDRDVQARIALVPEEDAVPEALTARQLVRYSAALNGVPDAGAVERSLAEVTLTDVADRRLGGFSKGMRQRAKVAAALVTDPEVLVLDEPLNGADPVQRVALIELFQRLGAAGRTVVVSSHVLHEVERLAARVVVVVHGRLAAAGDHRSIRDAMADRPRRVLLRSDDDRRLATGLLDLDQVVAVELGDAGVTISTGNAGELALALPSLSRQARGPPPRGAGARRLPRQRLRRPHQPMTAPTALPPAGSPLRRLPALVAYVPRACLPLRRLAVLALPCATILAIAACSPGPSTTGPPGVQRRRRPRDLRAGHAARHPRHRRRRARRRGPVRHPQPSPGSRPSGSGSWPSPAGSAAGWSPSARWSRPPRSPPCSPAASSLVGADRRSPPPPGRPPTSPSSCSSAP